MTTSSVTHSKHSLWYHLKGATSPGLTNSKQVIVRKVELSQKQAMRRDDGNIRVSSGVKYQLKFRGVNLNHVKGVEARLGRLNTDGFSPNMHDISSVHWLSFDQEQPIDSFDVNLLSSTSKQAMSPTSPQSISSSHDSSPFLKVSFSLKKFSQLKKIDKTLPPAKKITFVLSVRFTGWKGEAKVYFKFSTRSKAESSKEWKLEKVLDNEQHPNLIQLVEPSQSMGSSPSSSPVSTPSSRNFGDPNSVSGKTPIDMSNGHVFSNGNIQSSEMRSQNLDLQQQNYPNFMSTNSSMLTNGSYFMSQQGQVYVSNTNMFGGVPQLNFGMLTQQPSEVPIIPNQMHMQQQTIKHHGEKPTQSSRKRSRETFSSSNLDGMMQRGAKKRSLENQLDSLSKEEGPANKVHQTTGIGRFFSLKAPVFIFFGASPGRVECITPTEMSLLVPSHEPTPKAINVTVQNADRLPITSFAQYRFVSEDQKDDDSSVNSITNFTQQKTSHESSEDNIFFRDFDLDMPMESIFDSGQIETQLTGLDSLGQSLLHRAAHDGHSRLVLRLYLEGFSPLHKDNIGRTPLHIACARGNMDCAKILLYVGGADSYFENDKHNMTPIDLAASFNQGQLIEHVKKWLRDAEERNKYFDDVDAFCEQWLMLKEKTPWCYNQGTDDEQRDPYSSSIQDRMRTLEAENQRLRCDLEKSREKAQHLELRMKQRFVHRFKSEAMERRMNRQSEAMTPQAPAPDSGQTPVPTPEEAPSVFANSASNLSSNNKK